MSALWVVLMAAAFATLFGSFGVMVWQMHRDGESWIVR